MRLKDLVIDAYLHARGDDPTVVVAALHGIKAEVDQIIGLITKTASQENC